MRRIYPRGTALADIPPDARGISWAEWQAQLPAQLGARAASWGAFDAAQFERRYPLIRAKAYQDVVHSSADGAKVRE